MVKKILNLILLGAIAFSFTLCSSAEKKEESAAPEPSTQEQSAAANRNVDVNSPEAIADSLNEKLKDFRYPDGLTRPGFSYKKADVTPGDFSEWSKTNAPVIKEGLGKLPDSYALEITGHTDAIGPEQAEGAKKGIFFTLSFVQMQLNKL